jgi:hypothetical protein
MLTHQLESAIFHFLKKHYSIGAYFPYSFIKTHFPNETMGDIRKALNWLVDDKLIERIGKGEYKFINNESPSHFEIKEVNPVETQSKEIDKWLIEVIIQTIKKFKKTYNTYFPRDSLYIYSNTNSSREKFDYHIDYMIKNFIVVQDKDEKIIPYATYIIEEKLGLSEKESKKTSNKEIDINTEIRKIYGYITKKNKELKKEIEQNIYLSGKEIGEFHGNAFAKVLNEIRQFNKILTHDRHQKDEEIRSLRKDVNDLIQETKSLKCQNIKKE